MFCRNCGTKLPDDVGFCSECGTRQNPPTAQPAVQPSPAQNAPVATLEVPKKKRKTGLIITLAVILVAALTIGGLFLAGVIFNDDDVKLDSSHSSAVSTSTPPASPPESQPTPPPVSDTVELLINSAELTYEMTAADVDKFYELLEQCKNAALEGQSPDAVMEISDALDDHYGYMDSQLSIATVLYYCDLSNESASQLYLDCTEQLTQAYNDYMEMAKVLYDADFPAKESFFAEWTEQDLATLTAYTSEVMQLQQRNSEIIVAYQDLQSDSEMYTKMVPLYIEMVQNNNRLAQIFGYDNYYDYAYELMYTRDYGAAEINRMRTYATQYLPGAIENALIAFYDDMEKLNTLQQTTLSSFITGSFQNGYVDEIEAYLTTLPEQTQTDMLDMFNGNIIILEDALDARDGAFTTTISENRYICYFGPGYTNPLTVMHEVGHYYGSKHTDLNDIPLDLAETQSQGNEWLFMSYMENEMKSNLYNTTVDYKLYSDLITIMLSIIIDEFEEQVYTHPNIANLTSDDLDAIMAQVCERYGGIDFIGNVATNIQEYWRMVVVEQPVYYISYGVSAISAINIYTIADENYEEAVRVYCNLIESVDLNEGFLGNIQSAGLDGPFDEDVYVKLQALCQ